MPRNAALTRGIALLRLLEGRGRWTLVDLAARYAVTERTVRRDLDALQAAGVPVAHGYQDGHLRRGEWWLCSR